MRRLQLGPRRASRMKNEEERPPSSPSSMKNEEERPPSPRVYGFALSRRYGQICATDRFIIVASGGSAFIRR